MTTPPAHVIGVRDGLEARRHGKPRKSPYAETNGKPIKALRAFHDAWLKGWDAGTAPAESGALHFEREKGKVRQ